MENKRRKAPWWLSHKPIVTVDYEEKDAQAGDAKYLSLGHATWNAEDYSAKIWRWAAEGERWSRQSEEMPLWRVLDLATLIIATINKKESNLNEFVQAPGSIDGLRDYLNDNMELLAPRLKELDYLLTTETVKESSGGTPNIFDFATSELSQDAMFAWLIQWADPRYQEKDLKLHSIAKDFVRLLLGDASFHINSITVGRQWQNIDIWVEINEDTFLVIEDKTNTSIHDDQLKRYKKEVEKWYKGKRDNLVYAYVKTGNEPQSTLNYIRKLGYKTISRIDIINCLKLYTGDNTMVLNYLDYIKGIETETQSYRKLPVKKWGWYAWQGFYMELDKRLGLRSWEYVPNPSGGFLGAWWHPVEINGGNMYLQFEEKKLCFKVYCDGDDDRSEFRWKWHNKLMNLAKKMGHPEIVRPARFGAGYFMTIAVVDSDFVFGEGVVDIDRIIQILTEYLGLISVCGQER